MDLHDTVNKHHSNSNVANDIVTATCSCIGTAYNWLVWRELLAVVWVASVHQQGPEPDWQICKQGNEVRAACNNTWGMCRVRQIANLAVTPPSIEATAAQLQMALMHS